MVDRRLQTDQINGSMIQCFMAQHGSTSFRSVVQPVFNNTSAALGLLPRPLSCLSFWHFGTAHQGGENICKEDRSPRAFCDRGLHAPPDCSECASGGDVVGDPHITTLDGRRYTMLQQGNFLLWSFSGGLQFGCLFSVVSLGKLRTQ